MSVGGWPHVSFYPADGGDGFGGVYFGTGDSVLKKWWGFQGELGPAVPKETVPDGAAEFGIAKLLPINTSIKEFTAELDRVLAGNQATSKKVLIAFPRTIDGKLEREIRDLLANYKSGRRLLAASTAWVAGDKIQIYFGEAPKQEATKEANKITGSQNPGHLRRPLAHDWSDKDAERSNLAASSKFPSLEDQKLADFAWKRLNLELEPIGEGDLKRVKALGYDGGLKVVVGTADIQRANAFIQADDILVGLHAWPTTTMKDLAQILNRDDIGQLSPLKFYVVRRETIADPKHPEKAITKDSIRTGRIDVNLGGSGFGGGGRENSASKLAQPAANPANEASAPIKPRQVVAVDPPTSIRISTASPEELDILRERVKIAEEQFARNDEQYRTGARGGSKDRREVAAYELALAKANLALAEGKRDEALTKFNDAQSFAEEAYKTVAAAYDAGRVSYDFLRSEANRMAEIKLKVARLKREQSQAQASPNPVPSPASAESETPTPSSSSVLPAETPQLAPSIYFFHANDSAPSEQMKAIVKETAKRMPQVKVNTIDVNDRPEVALQMHIERVPTVIIVQSGVELGRLVGVQTVDKIASAIRASMNRLQDKPAPREAAPPAARSSERSVPTLSGDPSTRLFAEAPKSPYTAAPPPATATRPVNQDKADNSALRYDGKTFNEWQNAWRTELSTEKRIEAVKALAAFGANGYGKEAAAAILEIASQYDWWSGAPNNSLDSLRTACVEAFGGEGAKRAIAQGILANDSLPVLTAAATSASPQQKLFLGRVLPNIPGSNSLAALLTLSKDQDARVRGRALTVLPQLKSSAQDDKVVARIREALGSDDPDDVMAAMFAVAPDRNRPATSPYPYLPELMKTVYSPNEGVRRNARGFLQSLKGADAIQAANQALAVLKDESKKDQHLVAIRALAALGPNAKTAVDTLRPLVKSEDRPLAIAAASALKRILKQPDYAKVLYEELGKQFGLSLNGAFLQLPPAGDKQDEYNAFQRAVRDDDRQLFP
jgi:hypothetical protein